MKKKLLIVLAFIATGCYAQSVRVKGSKEHKLIAARGYTPAETLKEAQENRFAAKTYMNADKYDSARLFMTRLMKADKYVIPYDHLSFALCAYKMMDTSAFLEHLNTAIEGGVDSGRVKSYLRKMTGNDKLFLDNYLVANFEQASKRGWAKYDTALIKEAKSIERLDQFGREAMMTMNHTDSGYAYITFLQREADSMNYQRVARLMAAGKFPGYRNCGAFASLMVSLIHLGDYHEEQFDLLFAKLKEEVLAGNITPDEVATIVDNHYQRGSGKLCTYYGHGTLRTTDLCDCANVDKYRAEIGLEDLRTEYKGNGKKLPDCYVVSVK